MKLGLFQQIVELNHLFERLNISLKELESVPFFQPDLIRHARSDVEIARVYANREFFDNFEKIVEDDAKWAYRFQRAFDEKLRDRDDIYLEVRCSEERRRRKGLPPRVVILPGWDMSDEDRFDERRARHGKTSASKTTRMARRPSKESRPQTKGSPRLRTPKRGEAAHEKGETNDLRASAVRSRPTISRFAREGRGLG
jgi:hypothetical protein